MRNQLHVKTHLTCHTPCLPYTPRRLLLFFLTACFLVSFSLLPSPAHASLTAPIASYTIEVTLDTESKMLTAHEIITYVNVTGDPIPDLVFHLYMNGFRDQNSLFLQETGSVHRGHQRDPDHPGWIEITSARLDDGTTLELEEIEDGTLAHAGLDTPIAPGETVEVALDFRVQLPRIFARTGYAGDFFMVGQWFPKLGRYSESIITWPRRRSRMSGVRESVHEGLG